MRLFAAMLPPLEVLADLDDFLDPIRSVRPDLRWTPPDRWHLTLQFLGECGPHEVDRQLDRWEQRARRGRPMTLALHGAGAFPHDFIARAVWVGLGGDLDAWRRVAAADQQPHATVARTREKADLCGLVGELDTYRGPSWTAVDVVVMESKLRHAGTGGPHYRVVERFPLGAADEDG